MFRTAIALLVITACSSCMSKYVFTLTDKQVRERYAGKPITPEFGFIKDNGQNIFYAVQGDSSNPLLVLVHGAPGRWYSSINLFDDSLLLSRYRILAYDRPGYGKSKSPVPVTSINEQAEHLAALINRFNTTGMPVTVAGRSYGTPIAARYAMLYPQQIQKLLLLGSCIDPAKEKYFWFSYANLLGPVQHFMPRALNTATAEKFTHRAELNNILSDWEHIECPTYVIHGRKDWISDTANAWFAYNKITNAPVSVYMIDSSGHNITFNNPALVVSLLLKDGYKTGEASKGVPARKR